MQSKRTNKRNVIVKHHFQGLFKVFRQAKIKSLVSKYGMPKKTQPNTKPRQIEKKKKKGGWLETKVIMKRDRKPSSLSGEARGKNSRNTTVLKQLKITGIFFFALLPTSSIIRKSRTKLRTTRNRDWARATKRKQTEKLRLRSIRWAWLYCHSLRESTAQALGVNCKEGVKTEALWREREGQR